FLGWYAWAPCASWPAKSAAPHTGPWNKTTNHPILVMGISNDPNTPFANARRVSRRLGNAVLLKQEGYGHGTYSDPSDCATRAMGSYLIRLNPPEHQVCRSNRVPFDPRFGELPP
ncbi:MAG: alpha/beta hydrolase, partial [Thermoleophilia bacterium]|nr:alpha/beta hydrolase [Thermoleophilia bacterium]